jgi:hypothetical protein
VVKTLFIVQVRKCNLSYFKKNTITEYEFIYSKYLNLKLKLEFDFNCITIHKSKYFKIIVAHDDILVNFFITSLQ